MIVHKQHMLLFHFVLLFTSGVSGTFFRSFSGWMGGGSKPADPNANAKGDNAERGSSQSSDRPSGLSNPAIGSVSIINEADESWLKLHEDYSSPVSSPRKSGGSKYRQAQPALQQHIPGYSPIRNSSGCKSPVMTVIEDYGVAPKSPPPVSIVLFDEYDPQANAALETKAEVGPETVLVSEELKQSEDSAFLAAIFAEVVAEKAAKVVAVEEGGLVAEEKQEEPVVEEGLEEMRRAQILEPVPGPIVEEKKTGMVALEPVIAETAEGIMEPVADSVSADEAEPVGDEYRFADDEALDGIEPKEEPVWDEIKPVYDDVIAVDTFQPEEEAAVKEEEAGAPDLTEDESDPVAAAEEEEEESSLAGDDGVSPMAAKEEEEDDQVVERRVAVARPEEPTRFVDVLFSVEEQKPVMDAGGGLVEEEEEEVRFSSETTKVDAILSAEGDAVTDVDATEDEDPVYGPQQQFEYAESSPVYYGPQFDLDGPSPPLPMGEAAEAADLPDPPTPFDPPYDPALSMPNSSPYDPPAKAPLPVPPGLSLGYYYYDDDDDDDDGVSPYALPYDPSVSGASPYGPPIAYPTRYDPPYDPYFVQCRTTTNYSDDVDDVPPPPLYRDPSYVLEQPRPHPSQPGSSSSSSSSSFKGRASASMPALPRSPPRSPEAALQRKRSVAETLEAIFGPLGPPAAPDLAGLRGRMSTSMERMSLNVERVSSGMSTGMERMSSRVSAKMERVSSQVSELASPLRSFSPPPLTPLASGLLSPRSSKREDSDSVEIQMDCIEEREMVVGPVGKRPTSTLPLTAFTTGAAITIEMLDEQPAHERDGAQSPAFDLDEEIGDNDIDDDLVECASCCFPASALGLSRPRLPSWPSSSSSSSSLTESEVDDDDSSIIERISRFLPRPTTSCTSARPTGAAASSSAPGDSEYAELNPTGRAPSGGQISTNANSPRGIEGGCGQPSPATARGEGQSRFKSLFKKF